MLVNHQVEYGILDSYSVLNSFNPINGLWDTFENFALHKVREVSVVVKVALNESSTLTREEAKSEYDLLSPVFDKFNEVYELLVSERQRIETSHEVKKFYFALDSLQSAIYAYQLALFDIANPNSLNEYSFEDYPEDEKFDWA